VLLSEFAMMEGCKMWTKQVKYVNDIKYSCYDNRDTLRFSCRAHCNWNSKANVNVPRYYVLVIAVSFAKAMSYQIERNINICLNSSRSPFSLCCHNRN
jgi:hypothetical protein